VALIDALERGDDRAARKAVEADIRGSAELFAGAPQHGSGVAWLGVGAHTS
jgi:DNA-binding GntR family transcriptional regulator